MWFCGENLYRKPILETYYFCSVSYYYYYSSFLTLLFFRINFVRHVSRRCLDQTLWNLVGISYVMWSCAFLPFLFPWQLWQSLSNRFRFFFGLISFHYMGMLLLSSFINFCSASNLLWAKNVKFTPNFTNVCSNVSCHI
jgi:hypothetical protein